MAYMRRRLEILIHHVTHPKQQWREMETITGISRPRWKSACREVGQRVSQDMIEAVVKHWPQYTYWLIAGKTDLDAVQSIPADRHGSVNCVSLIKKTDSALMYQRLSMIIRDVADPKVPWSDMERFTGISRRRWIDTCLGKHRIPQDLIEAVAHHWPQYVCWLVAGKTDLGVFQIEPGGKGMVLPKSQ